MESQKTKSNHRLVRALVLPGLLSSLALSACQQPPEGDEDVDPATEQAATTSAPHIYMKKGSSPGAAAGTPHLSYSGGRVLSNVKVVPVYWGSKVNATTTANLPGFLNNVVKSSYIDAL